jgi:hypothetical protein
MKPKSQKREEAQERQEAYNKLSPTERLKRLDEKGHKALRERGKLLQKLMPSIAGKPSQEKHETK